MYIFLLAGLLGFLFMTEKEIANSDIRIYERISTEWINISEKHPHPGEIVWGWWRNKEVLLVQHFLSLEQIENNGLEEAIWYSIDHQEMGCVHRWQPLKKPGPPKIK